MRVVATFPKLRRTFMVTMEAYTVFLGMGALVSVILTGIETLRGFLAPALIYLTAVAFFTASAIMYSELRKELSRMRFHAYWKFFNRYSPPLGGYAVLHIVTGLVFITADLLKGHYAPLAIMLILKGVFEHALQGLVENLKAASFLYHEAMSGELDRLSMKDPFK